MIETTSNVLWLFPAVMIMINLAVKAGNSDVDSYPERWETLGY